MTDVTEFVFRRSVLFGAASLSSLALLPGCLFPLGIVLRGTTSRAFSAGATRGGTTALSTLGRGMGTAGRGAAMRGYNLDASTPTTRVLASDGRLLARTEHRLQATSLKAGTRTIFRSNSNARNANDVGRLDHIDAYGNNVGNSRFESNGRVEHFSIINGRMVKVGFDVIRTVNRTNSFIRHFDKNGNETGTSSIEEGALNADDEAEKLLLELIEKDERCPAVVSAREQVDSIRNRCESGDRSACRQDNDFAAALRYEEAKCE